MIIEVHGDVPDKRDLAATKALYANAFAAPPYRESGKKADEFVTRVRDYAADRDGFRLLLARSGGELAGFALTVVARPGDWWREQVAAHLGEDEAKRWLADGCVELVHLAVDRQLRRRGIGSALLAGVGTDPVEPRGVLACHRKAIAAQQLYLRDGWQQLSADFRPSGRSPKWLMARQW